MFKFLGATKTFLGGVGGSLVVVCGFLLMWSAVSKDVVTDNTVAEAAAKAIDIDASQPRAKNNGLLVVAGAELASSERLEDAYIKPGPYLVLNRKVEMFPWAEFPNEKGGAPEYKMGWYPGQVDFFKFQTPLGHENPLAPIASEAMKVGAARFGGFDGSQIVSHVRKFDPLALAPEVLKDPSVEVLDNRIVVRRTPGATMPGLGDVRVSYEVLPQGEYTVMAIQQDERTLLSPAPSSVLIIQSGIKTTDDFLSVVNEETRSMASNSLLMGAALLFFGLLSLLMPHRQKIDLSPHLNVRGASAVVVISAGLSIAVGLIMVALSFA